MDLHNLTFWILHYMVCFNVAHVLIELHHLCHIHQKMLLFGSWVCTLVMYSYEAVVKLKHQTSARISTEPAKQHLYERILAEMSGFTVNQFLSTLWREQQVIQNINCPFMPCEDGVQLTDFTEKYSKDGVESTVRSLTEYLVSNIVYKIWYFKIC